MRAHPKEVGPYRIERQLGEGATGQVFEAVHKQLEQVVALKLLRIDVESWSVERAKRFEREAAASQGSWSGNGVGSHVLSDSPMTFQKASKPDRFFSRRGVGTRLKSVHE